MNWRDSTCATESALPAFDMWGKSPTSATEALSTGQVDVDHTGTITLDELKLYFDKVGIPHDDLAKTFKVLDVDKESWMGHQNGGPSNLGNDGDFEIHFVWGA